MPTRESRYSCVLPNDNIRTHVWDELMAERDAALPGGKPSLCAASSTAVLRVLDVGRCAERLVVALRRTGIPAALISSTELRSEHVVLIPTEDTESTIRYLPLVTRSRAIALMRQMTPSIAVFLAPLWTWWTGRWHVIARRTRGGMQRGSRRVTSLLSPIRGHAHGGAGARHSDRFIC